MATHHHVSRNCVIPGRSSGGGAVPPQFFVSVHVSGGCFRRRISNQDGNTTATLSSSVSGLPTAPRSRKRRQESAAKLRQKKLLVEQTDVTRPGPSSASTFGSSDQDIIAPLTLASVPRDHDRDRPALIIAPTASDLPDPQTYPSIFAPQIPLRIESY